MAYIISILMTWKDHKYRKESKFSYCALPNEYSNSEKVIVRIFVSRIPRRLEELRGGTASRVREEGGKCPCGRSGFRNTGLQLLKCLVPGKYYCSLSRPSLRQAVLGIPRSRVSWCVSSWLARWGLFCRLWVASVVKRKCVHTWAFLPPTIGNLPLVSNLEMKLFRHLEYVILPLKQGKD